MTTDYPTKLRELAESLRGCEWNHPVDAAATCENAADMIAKYRSLLKSFVDLLYEKGLNDDANEIAQWIDVWEKL